MVNLQQDRRGNYRARKRLPDDVRDEYQRLYGARHEAKFSAPKTTKSHEAKRAFWEWLSEVEGRIVAIRAERDGSGRSLTRIEARALAGEWYEWFTARHAEATEEHIEWRREMVHEALRSAAGEEDFERLNGEVWDMEDVRESVRPVMADIAETEQFLALKQMPLTHEARALFLDFLYEDLAAATKRLLRFTSGDYSLDKYAERFPKAVKGADSGVMPWVLFEKWIAERQPAQSTIESWRTPLRALCEHFKDRSAASITAEEASAWVLSLVTAKRSARVVKKTWLNAVNTIYRWATAHKHVSRNPFADVKVTVPKKRSVRDTPAFYTSEWRTILKASLAITDISTPDERCKRWVPWLCAYTGARSGEITQLRGGDVIKRDGIHAIQITPSAGTVKSGRAHVVPLHEHLIAQGFLKFVARHGQGPLFYNPNLPKRPAASAADPTKQKKPRAAQARQRLAKWVRSLGVTDPNIRPNHAWRHLFKQIANRVGISPRTSDAITDHAPESEGARYGAPTIEDMAAALKRFPRYKLK